MVSFDFIPAVQYMMYMYFIYIFHSKFINIWYNSKHALQIGKVNAN